MDKHNVTFDAVDILLAIVCTLTELHAFSQ